MFRIFIAQLYKNLKKYLRNVFIATNQWINCVIFLSDPDETISSRLGKNYPDSKLTKIVNWLFKWQKHPEGHCKGTIEHDEGSMKILK